MANGDIHKLGSLYMNEVIKLNPTNPRFAYDQRPGGSGGDLSGGNIPLLTYSDTGGTKLVGNMAIKNTHVEDRYKIRWVEVNIGTKKYLVADRIIAVYNSGEDYFYTGINNGLITIDGGSYRHHVTPYLYENPILNLWKGAIRNTLGLVGLPTPTNQDKGSPMHSEETILNSVHNNLWHWWEAATILYKTEGTTYDWWVGTISDPGMGQFSNTKKGYRPVLEVLNVSPTITDVTENNRTLYENDLLNIEGNAKDTDIGDVLTVKYSINNGTAKALMTNISAGVNIPYFKSLQLKSSKLYDGLTVLTDTLAEGPQHTIKVWAEDDKGGKSTVVDRVFYVVANRPPVLIIDPFSLAENLIDTDTVNVSGSVSDPEGGNIKVRYKVRTGVYTEIFNGLSGKFNFNIPLSELIVGDNIITLQSEDNFNATSAKTFTLVKAGDTVPLKKSEARYRLTPPNGSAKGIILWVQRQEGDLSLKAEISMTGLDEPEDFHSMTKNVTAYVNDFISEDEFIYDAGTDKQKIIIKIIMERESTAVNKGITLISGVLS